MSYLLRFKGLAFVGSSLIFCGVKAKLLKGWGCALRKRGVKNGRIKRESLFVRFLCSAEYNACGTDGEEASFVNDSAFPVA